MNVLLIGGSGQLGTELQRRWSAGIVAPSHAELPLDDADAIAAALDRVEPDLLVNCAAFHNVDACEREPAEAFRYNAIAVDTLAAACEARDVALMTISTDYVFRGDASVPYVESSVPAPAQAYGVSKYAGELLVGRRNVRAFVVRACGIFGRRPSLTKGYTFVDRVINQARAGEEVRIVADVTASPTYAGHLAGAMWALAQSEAYGTYHVAATGPVTWYDFAVEALRQSGIDHPVVPISSSEWKAPAARPKYSALASERLGPLGISMPDWREGIAAYLRERDG